MFVVLEALKREIMVILIAAMPFIELRGSIPLGITLGLSPIHSTIISIIGNMAIVPILLKILNPMMNYLTKTVLFSKIIGWLQKRTLKKTKSTMKKYSLLGLFIVVAIPLPTTGAWTGCAVASLLRLDYKKSLLVISLGVLTAGIIVYLISYQVVGIIS